MPKVIITSILCLLVILPSVLVRPSTVMASPLCSNSGIDFTPKVFDGTTNPTLNFNVTDTTFSNIQNKWVRLNFGTGRIPGQVEVSEFAQVTSKNFSLTLTDPALKQQGEHSGALQITDDRNTPTLTGYPELCSYLTYSIDKSCKIVPSTDTIPPGSTLPIRFVGLPNTAYTPTFYLQNGPSQGPDHYSPVSTDDSGQGRFDIILTRNGGARAQNGDVYYLSLMSTSRDEDTSCSINISVNVKAPEPPPAPEGPITKGSGGIGSNCTSSKCTSAAGLACDTRTGLPVGSNGDGIYTAIGCIPTDPQAFISGLLDFSFGIGGGIAFLLMVMGAFEMITSAGNPETLKHGQERFRDAIIGLLFIIFAVLLLKIIGVDILNIQGFGA